MSNHKDVTFVPPAPLRWEDPSTQWTEKSRKRAKRDLYAVAESLDESGVPVDEVCKLLALFGQQIGDPAVTPYHWTDKLYLHAENKSLKVTKNTCTGQE